jgi:hypothetical protein
MQSQSKRTNRTIVVDFQDEATYHSLCQNSRAFIEFVVAFIMSIGFQLKHKCDCPGGFRLTRHSHYMRVRLNGLIIWRIQCTHCKAVFTVLPHFVMRYRKMKPETARQVLLATHGGLSLEYCAVLWNVSPMAIYRLMCAMGRTHLVTFLTRCKLPLPGYFHADEKHNHCLSEKVYLPTIVCGRVIWHLGYTTDKSAEAFEASYTQFQRDALKIEPSYRVQGILTDGFESTIKSIRTLFPEAAIGNCLLHAARRILSKLRSVSKTTRQNLSHELYQIFEQCQEAKVNNLRSLGQKLRRFCEKVTKTTGVANGETIRTWIRKKKAGWYTLFRDSQIPTTSTLLDQAHNAVDRKLFMMKGFHHEEGNQNMFLICLAILYNLIPYQRRANNAGKCGIEVEGGKLPTDDWFCNLQILTSGGFQ